MTRTTLALAWMSLLAASCGPDDVLGTVGHETPSESLPPPVLSDPEGLSAIGGGSVLRFSALPLHLPGIGTSFAGAGDLNGDGLADLITSGGGPAPLLFVPGDAEKPFQLSRKVLPSFWDTWMTCSGRPWIGGGDDGTAGNVLLAGSDFLAWFEFDANGPVGATSVAGTAGGIPTDHDGDGITDFLVLTASQTASPVMTLVRGLGDDLYAPPEPLNGVVEYTPGQWMIGRLLGKEDLNGDGLPDLLADVNMSNTGGSFLPLLDDGGGHYVAAPGPWLGGNFGDVDGDGQREWVCRADANLMVMSVGPDGALAQEAWIMGSTGDTAGFPVPADLDGDGTDEILMALNGGGNDAIRVYRLAPGGQQLTVVGVLKAPDGTGNETATPRLVNVDGDPTPEVVAVRAKTAVLVWDIPKSYSGAPVTATRLDLPECEVDGWVWSGDVDVDGHEDIVLLTSVGLVVAKGSPSGLLEPSAPVPTPRSSSPFVFARFGLQLSDVTGDDVLDFVDTGLGWYLEGDGLGGFRAPVAVALNGQGGKDPLAGDFDGDGLPEVVFLDNGSVVRLAGGSGVPPPVTSTTLPLPYEASLFDVQRLEADGQECLVGAETVDDPELGVQFSVWHAYGLNGASWEEKRSISSFQTITALGETPDGKVAPVGGYTYRWKGESVSPQPVLALLDLKAEGGAPVQVDVPLRPTAVATGDLDGDGQLEALVGGYKLGLTVEGTLSLSGLPAIVLLPMPGTGARFEPVYLPCPSIPRDVATADFNGDGKMDVVAATSVGVLGWAQE